MASSPDSGSTGGSGSPGGRSVKEHFSLRADPFSVPHDPRFLLGTKPIQLALMNIRGLLEQKAQLIVVTGEVGSGKTALVDATLREIQDGINTARILNPTDSWAEISREIGSQLRLRGGSLSPATMVVEQGGERVYRIIIDRAERLSADTLRHLGAYLDLQAPPDRAVHRLQLIVLTRNDTRSPIFSWISDRSHALIELQFLEPEDAQRYILRRLQMAGGQEGQIFSEPALVEIAHASMGFPGSINRLCRGCLEIAAARSLAPIDVDTVRLAQEGLAGQGLPIRRSEVGRQPVTPSPVVDNPLASGFDSIAARSQPGPGDGLDPVEFDAAMMAESVAEDEKPKRRLRAWGIGIVVILGIMAGSVGWPLLKSSAPVPEPEARIVRVEVPVEVRVEVPVPVPIVVPAPAPEPIVEVVEKPAPPPVLRKAPKPRPKPVEVARLEPKPAPVIEPRPPARAEPEPVPEVIEIVSTPAAPKSRTDLGPLPDAREVLIESFRLSRAGDHIRTVELIEHVDGGEIPHGVVKFARSNVGDRVMTLGVLEGIEGRRPIRILSIETGKVEDDRFSYRPPSGKVRRLKGKRAVDPFEGTLFDYDDFRVRQVDQYLIYQISRSQVENQVLYVVSAKPRYRADHDRVEFVIHSDDYALLEAHYYGGIGIRPFRILQYPRVAMEQKAGGLIPMRVISHDLATGRVGEARVVDIRPVVGLDRKLFTLSHLKQPELNIPML